VITDPVPNVGSPIHFTAVNPGDWRMEFATKDERWTLPVIGWAVVVQHEDKYVTGIEPVVLENGWWALTLEQYLGDRDDQRGGMQWRLEEGRG
jgi:hypothetical protein